MMVYNYSKTTYLSLCGLFAAVMAICSFITIPLGFTPVPVNLGTLGVFLTGGILGKKYGIVSMSVYVLLGAVGVPVFAGFRGGLGVLAGPTGGYIIGYIVAVFIIGLLIEKWERRHKGSSEPQPTGSNDGSDGYDRRDPEATSVARSGYVPAVLAGYAPVALAMIAGLLVCYILGTCWFIISTGTGVWASLIACVFPFLPGDGLKIVAAVILVRRIRHIM